MSVQQDAGAATTASSFGSATDSNGGDKEVFVDRRATTQLRRRYRPTLLTARGRPSPLPPEEKNRGPRWHYRPLPHLLKGCYKSTTGVKFCIKIVFHALVLESWLDLLFWFENGKSSPGRVRYPNLPQYRNRSHHPREHCVGYVGTLNLLIKQGSLII